MDNMLMSMAHKSRLIQRNLKGLPIKYAIQTLKYILEDLEKVHDQEMLVSEKGLQLNIPADEDV